MPSSIAVITTSYPQSLDDPSGHFVRADVRRLVRNGSSVHVLAPGGSSGHLVHDDGITLWPIEHWGAFGWPGAMQRLRRRPWAGFGACLFINQATRTLRAIEPARVYAHWLLPSAFPIAWLSHATVIHATAHGADIRLLLRIPRIAREAILLNLLTRGVHIRFVARTLRDSLLQTLPRPLALRWEQQSSVLPAALDLPDTSQMHAHLRHKHGDTPLIVVSSRLIALKRLHLAIRAAQLLGPSVRWHVLGDGPERTSIELLDTGNIVTFHGRVDWQASLAWIRAADVLVHPSAVEAAPTVVREARALGTPVVACDAGDVRLWARSDHGIAVVEPSAEKIAIAVRRILENSSSPHSLAARPTLI